MKEENKCICEMCGKSKSDLYTREELRIDHGFTWVCDRCFKKLEKVKFEDYTVEHFYKSKEKLG